MALIRDSKGRFALSNKVNLDIDLIISLYKNGMSLDNLAKRFNCSTMPIVKILKKNNIERRAFHSFGKDNPKWRGGRFLHKGDGYMRRSINGKKIREHHYIWIQANQMPVPKGCIIHHKNGIKTDNRIENLVLLPEGYHHSLHNKIRIIQNSENRYWGINRR